jgi:deazaflavin-dependent oxidoreductase (nitroreductase family)
MAEIEAPRDGTRGAGGLIEKQITYKILYFLHVPLYKLTGGLIGHHVGGFTTLLLTTTGAKSGLPRQGGLNYRRDGDNFIIIASKGGATKHPLWYRNLLANPECEVQVGRQRYHCRARTATAAEKPRLWSLMLENYKGFDHYQESTDREIPVVILEPIDRPTGA